MQGRPPSTLRGTLPAMRALLACLVAAAALVGSPDTPLFATPSAEASVSLAYTLEQLVAESTSVVAGRAIERRSEWAEVGGSRRIVTFTRVHVTDSVLGDSTKDVWVRTLGGVVGRIGQQVSGEATLALGEDALVFLSRARDGALVITGMGQGHYPIRLQSTSEGAAVERLAASPQTGTLLTRKPGETVAHARLVGRSLDEAKLAIRAVKR